MADKLYNKGFGGWAQLGIFLGIWGVCMVAGSLVAVGVWSGMTGQGLMNIQQDMLNPAFANAIKVFQFITTFFVFFLPAVIYAFICYTNGWLTLGFGKIPHWKLIGISILILLAFVPAIDALALLNKIIPLSAKTRAWADNMEKSYEEQVKAIGQVNTIGQYLLSLVMIALLPAVFEEVMFRGGLQNLLTRWKYNAILYIIATALLIIGLNRIFFPTLIKPLYFYVGLLALTLFAIRFKLLTDALNRVTNHYLFAIVLTSIIFSAIHGSWYGFLPRIALGMMLGLIFHYTHNIWYNIILHFLNNGTVVTFMYLSSRDKKPVSTTGSEFTFPWWTAIISVVILVLLYRLLKSQSNETAPQEIIANRNNPFEKH